MMIEEYMREAVRLSIENVAQGGGPFGCVIVKDGAVIARGTNRVTASNDPTAHAEIIAIREACGALGTFQLNGCQLYTSCEPCPMCLGAAYWARLDKIYYGNTREDAAAIGFDDHFLYREIQRPLAERTMPIEQMLRDEALEGFRAWERTLNKTHY